MDFLFGCRAFLMKPDTKQRWHASLFHTFPFSKGSLFSERSLFQGSSFSKAPFPKGCFSWKVSFLKGFRSHVLLPKDSPFQRGPFQKVNCWRRFAPTSALPWPNHAPTSALPWPTPCRWTPKLFWKSFQSSFQINMEINILAQRFRQILFEHIKWQ